MKQVAIINSSLKMSKGKIARVCLHLGTMQEITENTYREWEKDGFKGIVLKSNNIEEIIIKLKHYKIDYSIHIDAGLTQVKPNSLCGVSFFCNDGEFDFVEELKLL